ncbi:MAG TPA: alanine racemase [Acidimicrobiales bacterium]|nr:alanine racemase [Acidimicrobiales bacterium]
MKRIAPPKGREVSGGGQLSARLRPAWAEVDLGAVSDNVAYLCRAVAPARVCAVVKAFGYGHGSVPVARAALAGGATYLGVALAEEGHELRRAGLSAPVLVLSEPPKAAMGLVVDDHLTPAIYTERGLRSLLAAVRARLAMAREGTPPRGFPVHLKLDSGMHRVGATPEMVLHLAKGISADPTLYLEGVFTHFAVADEPANPFTAHQLAELEALLQCMNRQGPRPPIVHAANSAGALFHPASRYDMVRAGIAVYGLSPAAALREGAAVRPLRPVLSLKARVSFAKEVAAGERLSYGLRYRLGDRSTIATVPLGYADGVPRRLAETGGEVLIAGRRYPIAGTVTMDQILVDCGAGAEVEAGDEVVLLGRQGAEEITAWDWAERLGTIAYEVTCALSARLPRIYI